jgi:hypothetical protein
MDEATPVGGVLATGGWKGIGPGVLAEAGLVARSDGVAIPFRTEAGVVEYWKIVLSSGRAWYEPSGIELMPFGLETLASTRGDTPVFLCEGESDALALREMLDADIRAVALPGAVSWRNSWARFFNAYPILYVVGDGDGSGRNMNVRVKRDLPWVRQVWLPAGEDVRSIVQRDVAEFERCVHEADIDARLSAALAYATSLDDFLTLLSGAEL